MLEASSEDRDEINEILVRLTNKYVMHKYGARTELGKRFNRIAEEPDLDKLRVYENLLNEGVPIRSVPYFDHIMTMLRRNGYNDVAPFITKERFQALMEVEREIPKYSISIMNYSPFSPRCDALYLLVASNVDRSDDINGIMAERRTVDSVLIGALLDELSDLHPVLGGGVL